jgi:hypothetical protein
VAAALVACVRTACQGSANAEWGGEGQRKHSTARHAWADERKRDVGAAVVETALGMVAG